MNKFRRQDYFRYSRLGKKWRRPKGLQSKQRIKKGGSGFRPRIGYGSSAKKEIILIKNVNELLNIKKSDRAIYMISSTVGLKKKIDIAKKAKEIKFPVKGIGKILKTEKKMQKKKQGKQKKEEKKEVSKEKKEEEKKEKEGKSNESKK
ncbi:MAG TPA: eL32 family ribosomal protein [archaeon]|nr:eL32 family ribosomal protein [archaeon]